MRPGQLERRTHDYKRHATTSLFAAVDLKSGRVIGPLHRRDGSQQSPTNAYVAESFAASKNWRRLSANIWTSTMKVPGRSSGRKQRTPFWPAWRVMLSAHTQLSPADLFHESMRQETRLAGKPEFRIPLIRYTECVSPLDSLPRWPFPHSVSGRRRQPYLALPIRRDARSSKRHSPASRRS